MPLTAGAVRLAAAVSTLMALGNVLQARAETLPKEACDAAEAERAQLTSAGVPETVKKGPAWAKANLGRDKLKEVERYIALQEQLLFKCGQAKLRTLPQVEGEEGAEPQPAATDSAAPAPAAPPPKSKPAPKKAPAKSEASATSAAAGQPVEPAKPASKPRPKPKPKVDDAYKPPPAAGEPVKP